MSALVRKKAMARVHRRTWAVPANSDWASKSREEREEEHLMIMEMVQNETTTQADLRRSE